MPGSILEIIAAVTMLIDHAGLILFPEQHWMRIKKSLQMQQLRKLL